PEPALSGRPKPLGQLAATLRRQAVQRQPAEQPIQYTGIRQAAPATRADACQIQPLATAQPVQPRQELLPAALGQGQAAQRVVTRRVGWCRQRTAGAAADDLLKLWNRLPRQLDGDQIPA